MAPLWAEVHRPNSEAALVVAKRKIADVREFLAGGTNHRLLVLRGPPGSGKATVLRSLCADLGFEVVEWSPATSGPSKAHREPLADSFLRFFAQTDRYGALESAGPALEAPRRRAPRVTLVRDFPFTLLDAPGGGGSSSSGSADSRGGSFLERFRSTLNGGAVRRAVLCFNDSREDHRAVTRLLQDVQPGIAASIHFDAVPRTFAQRALDAAARAEGVDPVAAGTAAIAVECGGDLRHAFNALQLAAERARLAAPAAGLAARGGRGAGGRQRGRARGRGREATPPTQDAGPGPEAAEPGAGGAAAESGLRTASLGLFHALGRLLYNKRVPPPGDGPDMNGVNGTGSAAKRPRRANGAGGATSSEPKQLPHEMLVPKATRPPLYFVPEEVLNSSSSEPATVVDWLFTNAPRFYGDVGDLAEFAAGLASADAWQGSSWQPRSRELVGHAMEELASSVQARSLLDANLHPVPPSFSDPCGALPRSGAAAAAFNMVRPLMRDVAGHRGKRLEELSAHLELVGPRALGAATSGAPMLLRTLPFVDLLLRATRGQHRTLGRLDHSLMRLVQELCAGVDSELLRTQSSREEGGARLAAASAAGAAAAASNWSAALADDPIE